MSAATKKKYVVNETLQNYLLPNEKSYVVKIVAPRGNNLHEVITPDGNTFLVTMPTKFRNTIYIKRGDYVIVEDIKEGDKVKAEIVQVLLKDNIRYIRSQNLWPKEFTDALDDQEKMDKNSDTQISDDLLPPDQSDTDESDNEEENNHDKYEGKSLNSRQS